MFEQRKEIKKESFKPQKESEINTKKVFWEKNITNNQF